MMVLIFLKAGGLRVCTQEYRPTQRIIAKEVGEKSVGKSSSPEGANQTLYIRHGPSICLNWPALFHDAICCQYLKNHASPKVPDFQVCLEKL